MFFTFDNNLPIYIQLVQQLKSNIISGRLKPLERLPSVRELAMQTKVNPNTMQKALAELEETGLIFTERTNGKFVTADTALIARYRQEYAEEMAKAFLEQMAQVGFDREQCVQYLQELGGK